MVNVPSGTCVEGLFSALTLSNDQKMSGLFQDLNGQKSDPSNAPFLFPAPNDGKSDAFALVAHGYVKFFILATVLYIISDYSKILYINMLFTEV